MRGYKNSHVDLKAEFVRKIFNYDEQTGVLSWKITLSKRAVAGRMAGFIDDQGRIKVGIKGKEYFAHRIIWLWMTSKWPKKEIDHCNEIKSDNSWKNLRAATSSQNHRNRGPQKNNTVGYKGVCFDKRRNCYIAGIKLFGYRHNLGSFKTPKAAYKAYCKAAKQLHGRFAKTH